MSIVTEWNYLKCASVHRRSQFRPTQRDLRSYNIALLIADQSEPLIPNQSADCFGAAGHGLDRDHIF